jgi:hypothetical protein
MSNVRRFVGLRPSKGLDLFYCLRVLDRDGTAVFRFPPLVDGPTVHAFVLLLACFGRVTCAAAGPVQYVECGEMAEEKTRFQVASALLRHHFEVRANTRYVHAALLQQMQRWTAEMADSRALPPAMSVAAAPPPQSYVARYWLRDSVAQLDDLIEAERDDRMTKEIEEAEKAENKRLGVEIEKSLTGSPIDTAMEIVPTTAVSTPVTTSMAIVPTTATMVTTDDRSRRGTKRLTMTESIAEVNRTMGRDPKQPEIIIPEFKDPTLVSLLNDSSLRSAGRFYYLHASGEYFPVAQFGPDYHNPRAQRRPPVRMPPNHTLLVWKAGSTWIAFDMWDQQQAVDRAGLVTPALTDPSITPIARLSPTVFGMDELYLSHFSRVAIHRVTNSRFIVSKSLGQENQWAWL